MTIRKIRQETGNRQVCPLCAQKGMTPENGHVPAMKTNVDGSKFCFRCGVEFPGDVHHRSVARYVTAREVDARIASTSVERAMLDLDIRPLPSEPETRFQAECLHYLANRGITSGQVRAWYIHYAVTGVFANRVVFPCYGMVGIEFFVARAIYGHMQPKVLHPAKGGLWPGKSEVLWGLNRVDPDPPEIVICEGVFDAAVVENGVAIFGKHLSHRQMTMIAMRTKRIAILLDGDAVPEAFRMREKIRHEFPRLKVRVVTLPDEKDPSDLGADEVRKLLA